MEIIGTINSALSVARTLKDALEAKELIDMLFGFGCKSEIDDFKRTVAALTAVLKDAESKDLSSPSSHQLCHQIEQLKDAFYEADDLLDEFVFLAHKQRLLDAEGSLREKIRNFFSRSNPICVSFWMSRGIKDIKKKLDAIASDKQFGFEHNPEPIRLRNRETCSYVDEVDIIGRGQEVEKIVGMFLDPTVEQDVSFLSIVGIGGIGKTAFAQLMFNNSRVTSIFPLRLWACVSDQDQKQLDAKEVIGKILASVDQDEGFTLDQKRRKLEQLLTDKRFLLVLDDVWTEKREEWNGLVKYFVGGQRGSWIVVTTRSQETAKITGSEAAGTMHELQGLSKEDSWHLFKRIVFGPEESNLPLDDDLIELGQEIVDGCARVPLAIRVVGGLLYGQEKSKWQSVKEIGLENIRQGEDGMIMSTLELSYHHLAPPLKSCFNYCALFPKDHEMEKEMLIDLWIAQDYVVPFFEGQSVENARKEYFSILLKRCFFQDVKRNECDEIVSCKMHDLVHDVAQSVSRKEISATSGNINEKVRHFSIRPREYMKLALNHNIRSCILLDGGIVMNSFVVTLASSCRYLRVLSLVGLQLHCLSDCIGTLLHLRYLDISYNVDLEVLPKSISNLYNLQTLKVMWCEKLLELPQELSKLVKLRVLDITNSWKIRYMPRDMEKLTRLNRLSDFIVGGEDNCVNRKQWFEGLDELKALKGLKGDLRVQIWCPGNDMTGDYIEKGCVLSKHHLTHVIINFYKGWFEAENIDEEVSIALMKDLHPPPNLKILEVKNYCGTRMPDWGSLLPNLVKLVIDSCYSLKEWGRRIVSSSGKNPVDDEQIQSQQVPCLPHLKSLKICLCEQLTWIPMCPKLELLDLNRFNERLVIGEVGHASSSSSTSTQEVANWGVPKFKQIEINNVAWLNSLPGEAFHCLETLRINYICEVEKLAEVGEVLRSCSSLRRLEFYRCGKVRSVVGGGLEHLTALQVLRFYGCENLKLEEDDDERKEGDDNGSMPLPSLLPSLHTLHLWNLPKLENLPKWMQFLTALQTLEIDECQNLKAMPNWMPKLTSLRNLHIWRCSESLKRRCKGEDLPFIKHIPSIRL